MGFDRNTLIGFLLIGALLIGMFVINSKNRLAYEGEQQRIKDSIAKINDKKRIADSLAVLNLRKNDTSAISSASTDTLKKLPGIAGYQNVEGSIVSIENDLVKVDFTTRGGQPVKVTLKKYRSYDSSLVVLQQGDFNKLTYPINSGENQTSTTADINFTPSQVITNADNSRSITFTIGDSTGKRITHQYTLRPGEYMMDFNLIINGADKLFSQQFINLTWQTEAGQIEKDHKYETSQTHISYVENGDYDFEYVGSGDDLNFKKDLSWVGVKQGFFAAILLAKNKFQSGTTEWKIPSDSSTFLTRTTSLLRVPVTGAGNVNIPMQLYYGPSDYNILKKYDNQLENVVPYGSGVFAFVKYINRHLLLPVFDFIQKHVASMGIVILLLTLFIRLITSPILYKSYLSGAKMKALKPEVDALKAKFTDAKTNQLDQQAFGMEQMKLWRSAGVSPLGGCLPALLQIPIFMSLYYFFQSNIDLRGKNFLWASDLATYDSIAKLPFSIPFYGDHVSLFTLTAVVTSLLISIYSMSNMQDNSNPLMKYMPYIFPVLLLGVFNSLPAALTWYYTVSNSITLILQIVIQKYIINHEKILAQINENMKKPVKKSKLQERVEAMQESQKKLQDMKNKPAKK